MKKTTRVVLATGAVLLFSGAAFAGSAANNTGCGLGSQVFGNSADNSVLLQVLQATTNGTSGNQTFGISSGTLGCEKPASFVANERAMEFLTANMDAVSKDMAMGQGESLETMAELLDIPAQQRPQFYGQLQSNFAQIFVTGQESSAVVMDRISSLN